MKQFIGVTNRIAYITRDITKNDTLIIVQEYASTSEYEDVDIEMVYEELRESPSSHIMIIGDFNAKIGKRKYERETTIREYGLDEINEKGDILHSKLPGNE